MGGHTKNDELELNWPNLVAPRTTLVVYMGLASLPRLVKGLLQHGMDPKTPAAAVQDGTSTTQRHIVSPVELLPQRVVDAELQSPTLILIGPVTQMIADAATPTRFEALQESASVSNVEE